MRGSNILALEGTCRTAQPITIPLIHLCAVSSTGSVAMARRNARRAVFPALVPLDKRPIPEKSLAVCSGRSCRPPIMGQVGYKLLIMLQPQLHPFLHPAYASSMLWNGGADFMRDQPRTAPQLSRVLAQFSAGFRSYD